MQQTLEPAAVTLVSVAPTQQALDGKAELEARLEVKILDSIMSFSHLGIRVQSCLFYNLKYDFNLFSNAV